MNKNIIDIVEKIKTKYIDIYIKADYLENDKVYEIWYDKKELKYNQEFQNFVGKIIFDYIQKNDPINFFIDYNQEKANSLISYDTIKREAYEEISNIIPEKIILAA